MATLIIPCASPSKEQLPLIIDKGPDGRYWIQYCVDNIVFELFDRVIVTLLKEDVVRWNCQAVLSSVLDSTIEYCILDKQTNGPADTVYQTIIKMEISGAIVIKDSDCSIQVDTLPVGDDFVVGIDVESLPDDVPRLKDKSFIVLNEQFRIIDIAEKQLKSNIISLGLSGFSDAADFQRACNALSSPSYDIVNVYISYCISYLIGSDDSIFTYVDALSFQNWGSVVERNMMSKTPFAEVSVSAAETINLLVDLDGTLFNTDDVNFRAYSFALEAFGWSLTKSAFFKFCAGRKYHDFLPKVCPGISFADIKRVHEYKQKLYSSYLEHATINRTLVSLLYSIKSSCKLCLVTTASRKNTFELLSNFELNNLFDAYVTGDDVVAGKPDPEAYIKAISILNTSPANCIAIEDSKVGRQSALSAGIQAMVVTW